MSTPPTHPPIPPDHYQGHYTTLATLAESPTLRERLASLRPPSSLKFEQLSRDQIECLDERRRDGVVWVRLEVGFWHPPPRPHSQPLHHPENRHASSSEHGSADTNKPNETGDGIALEANTERLPVYAYIVPYTARSPYTKLTLLVGDPITSPQFKVAHLRATTLHYPFDGVVRAYRECPDTMISALCTLVGWYFLSAGAVAGLRTSKEFGSVLERVLRRIERVEENEGEDSTNAEDEFGDGGYDGLGTNGVSSAFGEQDESSDITLCDDTEDEFIEGNRSNTDLSAPMSLHASLFSSSNSASEQPQQHIPSPTTSRLRLPLPPRPHQTTATTTTTTTATTTATTTTTSQTTTTTTVVEITSTPINPANNALEAENAALRAQLAQLQIDRDEWKTQMLAGVGRLVRAWKREARALKRETQVWREECVRLYSTAAAAATTTAGDEISDGGSGAEESEAGE
ncbi:unnamed protein product [Periconia digitata]|uniref:Uncharacterized protein n=1 Tax=Periconia digitata TaxID=1303443 RepID=A0A9W4U196_9PLEO|nr:unnamed protein product [Periconia digitata]